MQSHSYCCICCPEITLSGPHNPVPSPHTALHTMQIPLPASPTDCCMVVTLPTKTPLLPDYKLGTNSFQLWQSSPCWMFAVRFFSFLCCHFGFLAWLQPNFFKLVLKQGMGNWSDLSMLKAPGQPMNSLRGFVIWRKNLYAGKAKSLYFDLCKKLLSMTKLPTSEKKTTN